MRYKAFGKTGKTSSVLGFGMMRLPKDENGVIDQTWTTAHLREAIDRGLTYVDTAYAYPGSEEATGIALGDGYREKVMLATKLPMRHVECEADFDLRLNESLERLQTDHADNYLLHALDRGRWEKQVLPFHLLDHMTQAKADGRIRHAGFSFHDSLEMFRTILDAYDWDFCQIQLNYLDQNYQAGLEGLRYAAEKGIAVVIMEPLRGGRLANVPQEVAALLPKSPVESALDFLWHQEGVNVVLSGMNTGEQIAQNLKYASRSAVGMLSAEELSAINRAAEKMRTYVTIPCTGCGYCSVCPMEIPIPGIFEAYNQFQLDGDGGAAGEKYRALPGKKANDCIGCRSCVAQCPQNIEIPERLAKLTGVFR